MSSVSYQIGYDDRVDERWKGLPAQSCGTGRAEHFGIRMDEGGLVSPREDHFG